MDLKGKYVVITGGSSGIGRALALEVAKAGANLVLAARNEQRLAEVKAECEALGAQCHMVFLDLESNESIAQAASQVATLVPQIDILVNNAGISQRARAADTLPQVEHTIMQTNYFGPVRLTKALWPYFNKQQVSIIVISSVVGLFGFPLRSSYAASKHALHGYFESVALESKGNPHVLIVCPGRINTPISLSALHADGRQHGQMDPGQQQGIPADVCAQKIMKAWSNRKNLVLIARGERLLWYMRRYLPALFPYVAKKVSPV
jgi:short-subunit dehydrogenase